jgi:N-acetylmuramoyl-L-alanine amidase
MQPLRRGAHGVTVADVRRMLASLGLLDNTDPQTHASYDDATELAVRHFQQRRGMSVDGVVGTETYTALTEAHWRLGDRVLAHEPGQLLTGDDVSALQTQLLELGYDLARADGVFGARTADGLRNFQRD